MEQPPVGIRHVIGRHREHPFGEEVVADEQRPRAGRLRQVPEHLAMGIDRTADEPSAVDAHRHPVRARAFRHRPYGGQPPGFGLQVVDPRGSAVRSPHDSSSGATKPGCTMASRDASQRLLTASDCLLGIAAHLLRAVVEGLNPPGAVLPGQHPRFQRAARGVRLAQPGEQHRTKWCRAAP
jgi:hypothetical protein